MEAGRHELLVKLGGVRAALLGVGSLSHHRSRRARARATISSAVSCGSGTAIGAAVVTPRPPVRAR